MSGWPNRTERLACTVVVPWALLLAACQARPPAPAPPAQQTAAALPLAGYLTPAPGQFVYRIDPELSQAVLLVRREGPLARFGHDHAIVARPLHGMVLWAPTMLASSRADLRINVLELEVDPPAVRQAFALDTTPDSEDIAGTRDNMLQHVLQGAQWPHVDLHLAWDSGSPEQARLLGTLTINGTARPVTVPAAITADHDRLAARGQFRLRASDWDIQPFSVLGGGLRVSDTVEINFTVSADRHRPARQEDKPAPSANEAAGKR